MENIEMFVDWMNKNPELAKKYYPEIISEHINKIKELKKTDPYIFANLIQKFPEFFLKWKTEAEQYFGIKRKKTIQGYINLINAVLIEYEYPTEIEQHAVESVRDELIEQKAYWVNELKIPKPIKTEIIPKQPETIIPKIVTLLKQFEFFSCIVDTTTSNYINDYECVFYNDAIRFEDLLTSLYLTNEIDLLFKVRDKLIKRKIIFESIDYRFPIEINELQFTFEPDELRPPATLKLFYIQKLISQIDDYLIQPNIKTKLEVENELFPDQPETLTPKKDYYTEICHAFNCNSFFDFLNKQTDLEELGRNLEEQLKQYARSCGEGYEKNKGDMWSAGYNSRQRWLKHTIFICKDEYNRTKKEIFNEAAKWCENWREKYLFQFNPYSPEEKAKMNNIWDIPLWEQLKNREQSNVQTNQETNSEKITRILEPIRRAFDTPDHLDLIVNALVQYSSDGMLPLKINSKVIQCEIAKFYPSFKIVKKESGLTVKGIATVLTYFICKPNSDNIEISTIEKNIKKNYTRKQEN